MVCTGLELARSHDEARKGKSNKPKFCGDIGWIEEKPSIKEQNHNEGKKFRLYFVTGTRVVYIKGH